MKQTQCNECDTSVFHNQKYTEDNAISEKNIATKSSNLKREKFKYSDLHFYYSYIYVVVIVFICETS